jgi:hypothetical protein
MNVKMEDLQPINCKRCRGEIFQHAVAIRRLSAILSPDGKEKFASIPVLVCMNCKELLEPGRVGGGIEEPPKPEGVKG